MKPNLIINPGEVLCDKCSGDGWIKRENKNENNSQFFDYLNIICDKCYGVGKLDWIEIIVGKEKPKPKDFNFKISHMFENEITSDFSNKIINNVVEQMAKEIDKQILDMLINTCEVKDEPKYIINPWLYNMS